MKLAYRFSTVLIIIVYASIAFRAKPAIKAPLPEWAPKKPSKEFLRVAKILKPLPPELVAQYIQGDPTKRALATKFTNTMPAIYDLFGSLSDTQLARFRSAMVIRVPVKLLTANQRAMLTRWFRVYRDNMKDTSPDIRDIEIVLYKFGAKADLTNVDVGFEALSHTVQIRFWVTLADGKVKQLGSGFAFM